MRRLLFLITIFSLLFQNLVAAQVNVAALESSTHLSMTTMAMEQTQILSTTNNKDKVQLSIENSDTHNPDILNQVQNSPAADDCCDDEETASNCDMNSNCMLICAAMACPAMAVLNSDIFNQAIDATDTFLDYQTSASSALLFSIWRPPSTI